MQKPTIALLAGGYTGESVVSLQSANIVYQHIDRSQYNCYLIIVDKKSWYYLDEQDKKIAVNKNDFSIKLETQKITFDCVFIMIHGSPGEDGKIQGYLDLLHIPYTSCDATTSAITMNKAYTKQVVKDISGLNVSNGVQLFKNQPYNVEDILKQVHLPVFVKPNNGGSSIGMSKVKEISELQPAIEKAFKEDTQVLIEDFIRGREFTVGAVKWENEIEILPVTEIKSTKEFFDYEAKYTPGMTQEITPANLSPSELAIVKQVVKKTYERLNCKGVVRIDFILENNTGYFYFIEINTIPGQSQNSIIPQQVRATGKTLMSFYTSLIEQTLQQQ